MSHGEKHIYRGKTSFTVQVDRGCRTVRKQFTFRFFGGEEQALHAARQHVEFLKGLTQNEFYAYRPPMVMRGHSPPGRDERMRYIRRLRPNESRGGGWMVMVPGSRSRTFADAKFGGESASLAAAVEFRDASAHARGLVYLLHTRQNPGLGEREPSSDGTNPG